MPQRWNSKTFVDTAVRELPRWSRYPNSLQMESTNSFTTVYSCVIFSSSEVKKLISLVQSQTLYRNGSRKMVQDSVGFVLMIKLTKLNEPIFPIIDIFVRHFHYDDTCVPRPPKSKNIKRNPQKSSKDPKVIQQVPLLFQWRLDFWPFFLFHLPISICQWKFWNSAFDSNSMATTTPVWVIPLKVLDFCSKRA